MHMVLLRIKAIGMASRVMVTWIMPVATVVVVVVMLDGCLKHATN